MKRTTILSHTCTSKVMGPLLSISSISPFLVPTRMCPCPRVMARMDGLSSSSSPGEHPTDRRSYTNGPQMAAHDQQQDFQRRNTESGLKGCDTPGCCTFGARRQRCSLDGVGLQAPLKHVVPEFHHAILPSSHKALRSHNTQVN